MPRVLETGVSILVLVDLAHESVILFTVRFSPPSFNPCFSGSCSRMRKRTPDDTKRTPVSILVLVDLAHEFDEYINLLFYMCFNPCFSGSCSRMRCNNASNYYSTGVSILVLVDLAHEFLTFPDNRLPSLCFNPCFSGSCSRIGCALVFQA